MNEDDGGRERLQSGPETALGGPAQAAGALVAALIASALGVIGLSPDMRALPHRTSSSVLVSAIALFAFTLAVALGQGTLALMAGLLALAPAMALCALSALGRARPGTRASRRLGAALDGRPQLSLSMAYVMAVLSVVTSMWLYADALVGAQIMDAPAWLWMAWCYIFCLARVSEHHEAMARQGAVVAGPSGAASPGESRGPDGPSPGA